LVDNFIEFIELLKIIILKRYMLNELLAFRTIKEIRRISSDRNINPVQPIVNQGDSDAMLYILLPGDHLYNGLPTKDENRIVIKSNNAFELKMNILSDSSSKL